VSFRKVEVHYFWCKYLSNTYGGADKSLALPRRKQARKNVRDACDFNNIEMRAVNHQVFFPARQGAKGNSLHSDRNMSLFLPGRAKDLSAALYVFSVTVSRRDC